MDVRKQLFTNLLGILPTDNDDQLRTVLFAPKSEGIPFTGLEEESCRGAYESYNESDFDDTPQDHNGSLSLAGAKYQDNFDTLFLDPKAPAEDTTGQWHSATARCNFLVISLLAQAQNRVHRSKKRRLIYMPCVQPPVNSKSIVRFERVDCATNNQKKFTKNEGLLPVALGLVSDCKNFSPSTGATVYPYHPADQSKDQDPNCVCVQPLDPPAGFSCIRTKKNKKCQQITMNDVQQAWSALVSNNVPLKNLISDEHNDSDESKSFAVAIAILLNGIQRRYNGLQRRQDWSKLCERLIRQGKKAKLIQGDIDIASLKIESEIDLCHVTYLLFDLVVHRMSLALVDGSLRTLVARMVATWRDREQIDESTHLSLRYDIANRQTGLKNVSQETFVEILIPTGRDHLSPKHAELLRARSHKINVTAAAAVPRGISENLIAIMDSFDKSGNMTLDLQAEIKKKDLQEKFVLLRKESVAHLVKYPDIHTKETDTKKASSDEFIKNMHNLKKFPFTSHRGTNIFCTMTMLLANRRSWSPLETFVKLNGNCRGCANFKVSFFLFNSFI